MRKTDAVTQAGTSVVTRPPIGHTLGTRVGVGKTQMTRSKQIVSRIVIATVLLALLTHLAEGTPPWPVSLPEIGVVAEILFDVHATGRLSEAHSHDLLTKLAASERDDLVPLVAFIVGESKGDDEELLRVLRKRCAQYYGTGCPALCPFVRIALLKKELRGKSEAERVVAFERLLDSEDPILRVEAAKEMARSSPTDGEARLRGIVSAWTERREPDQAEPSLQMPLDVVEAARVLESRARGEFRRLAQRADYGTFPAYAGTLETIEGLPLRGRVGEERIQTMRTLYATAQAKELLSHDGYQTLIRGLAKGRFFERLCAAHIAGDSVHSNDALVHHLEKNKKDPTNWGRSVENSIIRVALLKRRLHGKPDADKREALLQLAKESDDFVRVEVGRELLRLAPEEGIRLLRTCLGSYGSFPANAEAARMLRRLGEPVELGLAFTHRCFLNYIAYLRAIENKPLW
jgi:hypothetical protein